MGVRFLCPQGHKLHVKADLAGKRGICPECGAKFVVPSFSGGRVAADASPASAGSEAAPPAMRPDSPPTSTAPHQTPTDSIVIQTQPSTVQSAATPGPTLASANEQVAWFVRAPSGGQFGPATPAMFEQWIADGRVGADSWVWRTGWPDWKPGGEAITLAASEARTAPTPVVKPALDFNLPTATAELEIPEDDFINLKTAIPQVELTTSDALRREMKRRAQRVRTVSTLFAISALVLLTVLVIILRGEHRAAAS